MNLDNLNEGLRFGQQEISKILANKDIRVGFEFEYHVDRDKVEPYLEGVEHNVKDIGKTLNLDALRDTDEYMTLMFSNEEAAIKNHIKGTTSLEDGLLEHLENAEIDGFFFDRIYLMTTNGITIPMMKSLDSMIESIENLDDDREGFFIAFEEYHDLWVGDNGAALIEYFERSDDILRHEVDVINVEVGKVDELFVVQKTIEDIIKAPQQNFSKHLKKLARLATSLLLVGLDPDSNVVEIKKHLINTSTLLIDENYLTQMSILLTGLDDVLLNAIIRSHGGSIHSKMPTFVLENDKMFRDFSLQFFEEIVGGGVDVDMDEVISLYTSNNPHDVIVGDTGNQIAGFGVGGEIELKREQETSLIWNTFTTNGGIWGIDVNDITEITTEYDIPDGVEVVTKPQGIKDAMRMLDSMTDHIGDVGFTTEATGLHVNVSVRGLSDFDESKINIVKLFMLADEKLMSDLFGVRNHVERMFRPMNMARILYSAMAETHEDRDTFGIIEKAFEDGLTHAGKTFRINTLHRDHHNKSERRIEWRFLGGTNYEKSVNTLAWWVQRVSYVTLLAYTDEFDREYKKAVVTYADSLLKRYMKTSIHQIKNPRWSN